MTEPVLRPATPDDLPTIFRAERDYIDTIEPGQSADWTAKIDVHLRFWLDHLDRTTVLELPDSSGPQAAAELVSAGFVMWMRDGAGSSATLITLQVMPQFRRQGLGRRLLQVFADQAGASGVRVLRLGVHDANPARGLYEQTGYQFTSRDGDYLLYELTLPDPRS